MRQFIAETARDMAHILLLMACVAIPAAILMNHIHTQYQITQAGYDIAKVTRKHRRLMEDNKKLAIEAAVQGRTERMTNMARDQFNLEPTRPEQIYVISLDEDQQSQANPKKRPGHAALH